MSMVGTFDSFTSARLGIYAAQHGLRTTGNNISNINTAGYTRQRVDQYSFKVGANDMYRSFYDNHIGAGALVQSISQVRDPYLDIRYRNISTETYHNDTWLAGLQNIASILDEVGKGANGGDGLLYAQLQDLAEKLRTYGANPTELNDRLVRNSATSLTALFHNAANRLESLYNETKKEFDDDLTAVNEILLNIRDLNKSIREAEIHGDTALEMRDERNRQIDALSQYMDIRVEYSYEDVGAGVQVEKLTISLNNKNPDSSVRTDESVLVDGVFATQLSVPEERPVLNTYGNEYAYLKGYTYLRGVTEDSKEIQKMLEDYLAKLNADLDEDNQLTLDDISIDDLGLLQAKNADGTPMVDADNNPIYLIGTNDSDLKGVITEKNDNLTIQLSQLVNAKGELWESSTTRWEEVAGIPTTYKRYAFNVDGGGLVPYTEAGDENSKNCQFKVNGVTYTVVDDTFEGDVPQNTTRVNASEIEDEKFAEFVAGKIKKAIEDDPNSYPDYVGYDIDAKDGQIIFTAENPYDPENPGKDLTLTVDYTNKGVTVTKDEKFPDLVKYESPVKEGEYPQYKYDEHGNVIQSVSYTQVDGKYYRIQIDTEYTHTITLDDNDLRGILQAEREMLTEEGEFASEKDLAIDENALIKRGIPYYIKSLDLLAQKFAEAYNQLNTGYAYNQDGYYIDENGNPLELAGESISTGGLTENQLQDLIENSENYKDYFLMDENGDLLDANGSYITDDEGNHINIDDLYVTQEPEEPEEPEEPGTDPEPVLNEAILGKITAAVDMNKVLEDNNGYFMGGPLFSNRGDGNDTTKITAANISIAADWSNGVYGLIPTFEMLFADDGSGGLTHSTQNDNASHMIAMIGNTLTYDPRDLYGSDAIGPVLFEGSFNDMLGNMMAVQGEDADITNVKLTTYAISLTDLDYSREGVSGVDLNDEAMNMITYQKAMTAAMRLMTTIDEMLDRLINNTGIAGR